MDEASPEELKRKWLFAAVGDKGNFFEFVIERLIEQFCGTGRCVIDAGANCGAHTATMLRTVGPTGVVFAFEPNPLLAAKLEGLMQHYPNLRVSRAALSDRSGEGQFLIATDPGYGSLHHRPQFDLTISETIPVRLARLDAFPELRTTRAVDFIQADVEGAEIALSHGASETRRLAKPLIVMEMDWAFSLPTDQAADTNLFGFLGRLGYGVHGFFGQDVSKRDLDNWNIILAHRDDPDLLAVRRACLSAGHEFFRDYRGWNPYRKFDS